MKVASEVVEIIDRSRFDGTYLFLPPGQLDRKMYEAVDKALTAAGGRWSRKARAHIFERPASQAVETILVSGEIVVARDFDFFWSPPPVVDRIMELADIRPGMRVLEPSAGDGRIAVAARGMGATVICVELLQANCLKLDAEGLTGAIKMDFLQLNGGLQKSLGLFDRVTMNPPFSRQADIDHIRHAHTFLKPGGRLVAVASAAVEFRTNRKTVEFREWLEEREGEIEALPPGSFKLSGTGVSTCIVTVGA